MEWILGEWTRYTRSKKRTVVLITILILVAVMCLIGRATGRFGPNGVVGSSMSDFAPEGSVTWSWPSRPSPGDKVIAWVKGDPTSKDVADRKPGRVVKRFNGVGLESDTAPTTYRPGEFQILSVVFAVWHTERIFPWLNTGGQAPAPNRPIITEEKHIKAVFGEVRQKSQLKSELWWISGEKVIAGKSLRDRMKSMPALDLTKASDRVVGKEPCDTAHAVLNDAGFTLLIDVTGLTGQLVFKPIAYVNSNKFWSCRIDGKSVTHIKELGAFVIFPVSRAHEVTLSNQLVRIPPENRQITDVWCCGVDEVILIQ